jgi:hypothetical protein
MKLSEYLRLNEKPTEPQGDTDEAIVLDYRARVKALSDIQSDTEIVRDPDLKQAVILGRAFLSKWRDAWIAAEPTRGMLFNKMRFESEEIDEWGNSILDQEIAKQKAEDDEKDNEEDVWAKNFKRNAKKRLRQKQYRDDQQADEFEEGMISGDWENLGITNDDIEKDDDFPGDTVWSVGRGGAPSKMFYFTAQNTGTHFATIIDIGNGTWKVEDADGKAITDPSNGLRKWAEAEAVVKKVYDKQAGGVEEGHTTLPAMDTERYTERKGLEGPMRARNGRVVYYDPKEGQYYDPDTDIYISNDDWEAMNEGFDTEKYEGVVDDVWFTGDDGEESGGELTYTAYLDSDTGRYKVDPNSVDGNIDDTNNPGRIPDDSVRDFMDSEFEDYVAMAQEHADEHAGERDNKYAHGESVEDDNVSNALDTMRNHLNDYNHDSSDRWEKYNQYRNERRQISQRAKRLK